MDYKRFLESKKVEIKASGFEVDRENLNPKLFDFQKDIVKWAIKKGKAALFADTGLGKTPMQLEWANQVYKYTGENVLILAPLAVSQQTVREGLKFGIDVNICRTQEDVKKGINITNYEMLQHFNISKFVGVVIDESSCLKSFTGKFRQAITEMCRHTKYKLSCTATPAPNDYMEFGTQCEWLGVMSRSEMLSTFFVHDSGDTAKWRLKGHAEDRFWEWIASWAVVLQLPSDLGYSDKGFILPPLNMNEIIVKSPIRAIDNQITMLPAIAQTLGERRQARRDSLENRVNEAVKLIDDEQWLIWCDLNVESEMLRKRIKGSVEVRGSDKNEHKVKSAADFANGELKYLVSKPSIFGWGLNFQSCHNMVFVGLSDSYEQLYQAIRRCWRFGQTKPVNVYIITSEAEGAVKANIERKEAESKRMIAEMVKRTKDILSKDVRGTVREKEEYKANKGMIIPQWLKEGTA